MQGLKNTLASTYALYLKTQNFHWNIEGSDFFELHELFEQQYTTLAADIDMIAEIIRTLGEKAPGTFEEFIAASKISNSKSKLQGKDIVLELIGDYKIVIDLLKASITELDNSEFGIKQQLSQLIAKYQKTVWMLHSWSR